ncbi:MAG: acyltransferase [Halobacteria archaeon]|nr:acyltransferase [Halobacteria archaeon]
MRRTRRFETQHNSLRYWTEARHPVRVVVNYVVILLARHSPSLRLKRFLLRLIGVEQGERVSWGLESTPDVFFPDLIEIGDDVIIGYDATILCHEFLRHEWRKGEVVIGDDVMIGANVTVLPGVEIGDGAVIGANSLVDRDVEPGEKVVGVPITDSYQSDHNAKNKSE